MTKANFFKYYNRLAGCHAYLVFFMYKGDVYMAQCHRIMPRWCIESRTSSKRGGEQTFRMSLNNSHKEQLIRKGAIKVFTVTEFDCMPYANKGHRCEWWLHQEYELGEYKPDRERFDKCGDVMIDGIEYQVKFENASLTTVSTLHNAQKDARKK